MATTTISNRKQLQTEIVEMYNNYTYLFVVSIPNGEIEQILRKNTSSLELVHDHMAKEIELVKNNN